MLRRIVFVLLALAAASSLAQAQTYGSPTFTTVKIGGANGQTITGVGTTAGTVAAGNDSRIVGAAQNSAAAITGGTINNTAIGQTTRAPGAFTTLSLTTPLAGSQGGTGYTSVSAALDGLFSSTYGAILYRGASAWMALAPGTAGQVLGTNGAGAAPGWVTPSGGTGTALLSSDDRLIAIRAAGVSGSYIPLSTGLVDGFADQSGIDTGTSTGYALSSGTIINQSGDAYTTALLHLDGTSGSTTLTDTQGHTFTATSPGTLSTAQFKFGTASFFTGSGGYFSSAASSDFALTGDGTVEGWFYLSSVASGYLFEVANGSSDRVVLYLSNGTLTLLNGSTGATVVSSSSAMSVNTWSHIALVKSGTTTIVELNGANVGSTTAAVWPTGTPTFRVAGSPLGSAVTGYADEVRFSKGFARYSGATYTVPSAAFTTSTPGGVIDLRSITYALPAGAPTKGSIFFTGKSTSGTITPNTNLIGSLSRNGGANWLDVALTATTLPNGLTDFQADEVDLTSLPSGSNFKTRVRSTDGSVLLSLDGLVGTAH